MLLNMQSTNLHMIIPPKKPIPQDVKRPYIAFIHSLVLIPANPLFRAIALPERPATRAWLSLVGMPKYQAATAHRTIEKSAAASAVSTFSGLSPKLTILIIVSVTAELILLITNTPAKFKIADNKTAFFNERQRVVMHVATEFGASVKPFTYITAKVSISVVMLKGERV